jgi:hypothetical protein
VLNWAPYGLYQDQSYHLLSAAEVADKKKLDRDATIQRYEASPKCKDTRRRYQTSEARKHTQRRYETSDTGKHTRRQYEAGEGRREYKRQASAAGTKRTREFLEEHENDERHAVQQKTNEPSCGVLGALLGGS